MKNSDKTLVLVMYSFCVFFMLAANWRNKVIIILQYNHDTNMSSNKNRILKIVHKSSNVKNQY